ncbi:MAG: adenosylmethionine--8-amino-7-oxononanoate transaminase [Chthoniobacterales bacterium]|nr:adenosylmethionine--8-amino-7-oxononanoate transaminase [Chthoniobacterales bacterium]
MSAQLLRQIDQTRVWHPFTQMRDWCAPGHDPLVVAEGHGSILIDIEGREYLDGNSSIWTNIHGHSHPRIVRAIQEQAAKLAHSSFLGLTNEPAVLLAEKLAGLFPPETLTRVFYSDNGSTAIEVALKMAVQYHQLTGNSGRCRFVAFDHAYHGDTAGAASLGGIAAFQDRFAPLSFPVVRVADFESLENIDAATRASLAALVIEPLIQGAGGMRVWPAGLLRELRGWCDRNGIFLILDEVMTGFGRTGKMFACGHEGVVPDFIALAKGLTGGTMPLAATLTTEKIFEAFLGDYAAMKTLFYGHSYCGNPLGCASALASLAVFEEEKTLENLQPKIARLAGLLGELAAEPHVGAVRQCGFIAGIDVVRRDGAAYPWQEQTGARICLAARRHGLLTRPIRDTLVLMPPLCFTAAELERAVGALRSAIREVCGA